MHGPSMFANVLTKVEHVYISSRSQAAVSSHVPVSCLAKRSTSSVVNLLVNMVVIMFVNMFVSTFANIFGPFILFNGPCTGRVTIAKMGSNK